ncbi:MAG: hypothetical protein ACLR2E_18725 [Lachnospiraceae bacterium]
MAMFDTHYYGGIKKYQWVALPLASLRRCCEKRRHNRRYRLSVTTTAIRYSESPICFLIWPVSRVAKTAAKIIEGEDLNLLIGSIPVRGEEKEAVKKNILAILKEKYDIEEDDFISAELEVVPAGAARDYGFDRSMIMGYGHDDRVCAYPSYKAMFELTA